MEAKFRRADCAGCAAGKPAVLDDAGLEEERGRESLAKIVFADWKLLLAKDSRPRVVSCAVRQLT